MKQRDQTRAGMSRRDAIKSAVSLLGGALVAAEVPALAFAAQSTPRFLSGEQLATLKSTVDIMIPANDTPGAAEAGVHHFIDMMLDEWASAEKRASLSGIIDYFSEQAMARQGVSFDALNPEQQFALLDELDAEAFGAGSETATETETEIEADGPAPVASYRDLKKLIVLGYYSSEIGGSVELKFNPVPGPSPGCVPLADIGRAWYKH